MYQMKLRVLVGLTRWYIEKRKWLQAGLSCIYSRPAIIESNYYYRLDFLLVDASSQPGFLVEE